MLYGRAGHKKSVCKTGLVRRWGRPPLVIGDCDSMWKLQSMRSGFKTQFLTQDGLVLSDQRHRSICRKHCRPNRIPALTIPARKREAFAVNVTTRVGLLPHRSLLRSM